MEWPPPNCMTAPGREDRTKEGRLDEPRTRITTDKQVPGHWRVTLNHPPINTIDDQMYDEIFDLVEAIDADPSLKVVTFESANPDFFLAHYGVGESRSRFGKPRRIEASTRLAESNFLSIAVVRGRARGGSEFVLACDVRFASREKAVFGQPEVGFGLIPGGGALERLPLLVGRSRALEIASARTISTPTRRRDTAGSTVPFLTPNSTASSPSSYDAFSQTSSEAAGEDLTFGADLGKRGWAGGLPTG